MRKSLDFIKGYLNSANDTTASSFVDPYTNAPPAWGGLVLGDFIEMDNSNAALYSNSSVGTLYAGVFQRIYLDPGAAATKTGQLLFWVLGGLYRHQVTNVESNQTDLIAGIYINGPSTGSFAITPGNFGFMQCFFPEGIAQVLMRGTLTNGSPAIGDLIYAAALGAGADNATCDDLTAATTVTCIKQARFIGVSETIPVGATLAQVELRGGMLRP